MADDNVFRLIVENARDLIVHVNAARVRTYVSPSSHDVLGYAPEELFGKGVFELVHPDDRDQVIGIADKLTVENPSMDLVFRMLRKDGGHVWIAGRYRQLPGDNGVVAMLRDITEQKNSEIQLAETNARLEAANRSLYAMVNQDGLTGLANRRCFDEALETEFRRARRQGDPIGLVLLDVDHFKRYNDRYGHTAGDECLRRISKATQSALRRPGDLAARYGGEELVALLPATDIEGAMTIADQVRAAIAELNIEHGGSDYGIATISGGASAIIPGCDEDKPLDLIDAADAALYRAKADGRNRVRAGKL